eukprot:m.108369 g.108369  ORF g.108369 m.108369 type:complete len:118 (-) comp13959_c0_seq8:79-432(-)
MGMQIEPLHIIINPKVTVLGKKEVVHRESCLSIPGYSAHVPRALAIEVSAFNQEGVPLNFQATGWTARIIQHEFDHLQGILYIDRMLPNTFADEKERWKHPLLEEDIDYDGESPRKT